MGSGIMFEEVKNYNLNISDDRLVEVPSHVKNFDKNGKYIAGALLLLSSFLLEGTISDYLNSRNKTFNLNEPQFVQQVSNAKSSLESKVQKNNFGTWIVDHDADTKGGYNACYGTSIDSKANVICPDGDVSILPVREYISIINNEAKLANAPNLSKARANAYNIEKTIEGSL